MFRPSGALGGSGYKQIRGEGMAEIMANGRYGIGSRHYGSHPWRHCHARPSVMRGARELKAQSLRIGRREYLWSFCRRILNESPILDWGTFPKRIRKSGLLALGIHKMKLVCHSMYLSDQIRSTYNRYFFCEGQGTVYIQQPFVKLSPKKDPFKACWSDRQGLV